MVRDGLLFVPRARMVGFGYRVARESEEARSQVATTCGKSSPGILVIRVDDQRVDLRGQVRGRSPLEDPRGFAVGESPCAAVLERK